MIFERMRTSTDWLALVLFELLCGCSFLTSLGAANAGGHSPTHVLVMLLSASAALSVLANVATLLRVVRFTTGCATLVVPGVIVLSLFSGNFAWTVLANAITFAMALTFYWSTLQLGEALEG